MCVNEFLCARQSSDIASVMVKLCKDLFTMYVAKLPIIRPIPMPENRYCNEDSAYKDNIYTIMSLIEIEKAADARN